jgi:hypothetical protein
MDEGQWKVGFITVIVILSVIIVALVILLILGLLFYNQISNALMGAFYNTNLCSSRPDRCNYINVSPAIPTNFPNGFSKELAIFTAQLLMNQQYAKQNQSYNIPPPLTLVGFIYGCDTCDLLSRNLNDKNFPLGYILIDPNTRTMYINYRGAETTEEWMYAFTFNQTMYKQQQLTLPGLSDACPGTIMVHSGLQELFRVIQPELDRIVTQYYASIDRIVLSGHSLGGVNASFTSLYLSSTFPDKPVYVYTFGKPRIGNIEYSECIRLRLGERFWRIQNEDDLIPSLPLPSMPNLSEPDNPYIYQQDGMLYIYQSNFKSQTLNHNLNNPLLYLTSLP